VRQEQREGWRQGGGEGSMEIDKGEGR